MSKFPILSSSILLLPRETSEHSPDDHQRACIHAEVLVEGWGVVDVFSVHLSLSEAARNKSVVAIKELMGRGRGVAQVFMGECGEVREEQERGAREARGEGSQE